MVLSVYLWAVVVALGPLLLAIVIVVALLRKRRLSAEERARQDRETDRLYEETR